GVLYIRLAGSRLAIHGPRRMTSDAFLRLADRLTIAYAVVFAAGVAFVALTTPGLIFGANGVIGSDFLAFYTAGEFAASGEALRAYDQAAFNAALKARAPLDHLGLMWQYPPSVFFLTAALTLLPFKASYILWVGFGWAVMALTLRHIGFHGRTLRLLALSPLAAPIVVSGQISFLTGAALALAAYKPKTRWFIAGIAAGLLTLKPQLGLLIPLAYVAVGAWRAILVAAAIALLVHAPSLLVFGLDGWSDFFMAVGRLNADVTGAAVNTPPDGMATLFGQLRVLGVPSAIATPLQYGFAACVAASVFLVWRSDRATPLAKAAALCAGAILASPYAYSYEMTALVLPAAFLAAAAPGLRSRNAFFLTGAWVALVLAQIMPENFPIQTSFVITVGAFALTLASIWRAPAHSRPALSAL
ncbi:MAG: glycosyltransferase family 87 protein, partial [Amphiplicatus sp.]